MAKKPPANGLTRPPDEQDLVELARELNRLGARYLVIGGVAINRLGFIRATEDIDLLIDREMANQVLVKRAMEVLPDGERSFMREPRTTYSPRSELRPSAR